MTQKRITYKNMVVLLNIFSCFIFLTSCEIDDCTMECKYNVQINYRYTKQGTYSNGIHLGYIYKISEYIFDSQDVLYTVNSLPATTSYDKKFVSEQDLPAGKYTVISWANIENISNTNEVEIGVTTKDEMMLFLDNPYTEDGMKKYGNTERLYYSYRTFMVPESGICKVYSDMMHAHCIMSFTVKWKSDPPPNTGDFYILYKDIPSTYSFMPDVIFKDGYWDMHDTRYDEYSVNGKSEIYHVPDVDSKKNTVIHHTNVKMNIDKRIETRIITYRLKNTSHPLLSMYSGEKQIMKEVDLERFFKFMEIEFDKNFEQEFNILVEIDEDKVTLSLMNANDWEEGGIIS